MCAKLLILESPGKVKKIQEILGSGWKVAASVGHVRDLPQKEMGVAAPGFKPTYVPTDRGKEVLARLAGMDKGAEAVYLATDPDREGEAIAWHLADALKLKNAKRVTYSEITEKAVKAALEAPRSIDMALVAAQEGRRVLDRFCGYMVSGPLSNVAGTKLSAGRESMRGKPPWPLRIGCSGTRVGQLALYPQRLPEEGAVFASENTGHTH